MVSFPLCRFWARGVGFDFGVMSPASRWAFVAARMVGLVVIVPLVEELFWASPFLIRWLIDQGPILRRVPIGRITPRGGGQLPSVSFALGASRVAAAASCNSAPLGVWLLCQGRASLGACLVSHATANLAALGLYVIAAGDWKYW